MLEGTGLPPGVLGGSESVSAGGYSGGSNFSEGVLNTDTAPVGSEAPVSASFQPETPSRRGETGGEFTHQTPPPSASAIIGEGLSLDSFDKAQQLIDQYGTVEGLRRLRETDPDAVRQFESVQRSRRERPSAPDSDAPDEP